MAYAVNPICQTFTAGADLSAKQYYAMALAADGQIDPAGDGVLVVGILQDAPAAAGDAAKVAVYGTTKAIAAAAFEEGIELASDAAGKLVTAASGERVRAVSIEPAAADGDIVAVLLVGPFIKP